MPDDDVSQKYFQYFAPATFVTELDSPPAFHHLTSRLEETFPFTALYLPKEEILACVEEKLPTLERALSLVEIYSENLCWLWQPVEREQIIQEIIPYIYGRLQQSPSSTPLDPSTSNSHLAGVCPHVLALLFAIFACGAVVDLNLLPWNEEAELYYHLSRTALTLKPVFDGAGLHAVQAIALLGEYDLFSCRKTDLEGSWKVMTFAMFLGASVRYSAICLVVVSF